MNIGDDSILLLLLGVFLVIAGYSVWKMWRPREGYEDYDEDQCLALAQKNEQNLQELEENMKTILDLVETVDSIKAQCDANTDSISQLVDQCK